MVNVTPQPLHPQEREPVPTVQEAGWAPGPAWAGEEFDPHNLINGLHYHSPYHIVQKNLKRISLETFLQSSVSQSSD